MEPQNRTMDRVKPSFAPAYNLVAWSFRFYGRNFLPLLGLMLVAALGRAIQMEAAGKISSGGYILLEVAVELSRVLILILVLGEGSIKKGFQRCRRVFTMKKSDRAALWNTIIRNFKLYWPSLLWNAILFGILAFLTNYCIDILANNQQVLSGLKEWHVLAISASANPVVFFLKNLTVIPFTIIFECGIFLRLIGKI